MEQQRYGAENTDLIDVSDIEPQFDDLETERGNAGDEELMPGLSGPAESQGPTIASLKDRFSAFVVDALFLYAIYWFMMIIFRAVALGQAAGPIPAAGKNGIIFHALYLFIALIWFVVPEMAFSASIGKILCRLTIRRVDGAHATLLGIIVRNILKPLDLLLFPLIITAAMLEWSGWHQRLGDKLGRTVVLRKLGSPPRQYALSLEIVATACGRLIAFTIDLALFAAFAFGLALMLSPEQPLTSMMILVFSPAIALAYFLIPEWVTKCSPGKWVMGYAICHEDGSAIDFSSALLRTMWRIFDTNPFGFLTCLFSLRRQRPGDLAAGTVVINAPREWRGLIGFSAVFVISILFLYGGLGNRDSFLHDGFQVNFLPSVEMSGSRSKLSDLPANLITMNFRFAAGDAASMRRPAIFQPGETLYLIFEVSGYRRENSRAWIQEDLTVRYPDDTVGLKLENINDFNQQLTQEGPIRFENNIAIPEAAQPGRYTVTITVRDKLGRQELKEQRFFYVTPPEAQAPQREAQKSFSGEERPVGAVSPPPELPEETKPPKILDDNEKLPTTPGDAFSPSFVPPPPPPPPETYPDEEEEDL